MLVLVSNIQTHEQKLNNLNSITSSITFEINYLNLKYYLFAIMQAAQVCRIFRTTYLLTAIKLLTITYRIIRISRMRCVAILRWKLHACKKHGARMHRDRALNKKCCHVIATAGMFKHRKARYHKICKTKWYNEFVNVLTTAFTN